MAVRICPGTHQIHRSIHHVQLWILIVRHITEIGTVHRLRGIDGAVRSSAQSQRRLLGSRPVIKTARSPEASPVLIITAYRLRRLRRHRRALGRVVQVSAVFSKARALRYDKRAASVSLHLLSSTRAVTFSIRAHPTSHDSKKTYL